MQLEEIREERLSKSTIVFALYLFLLPLDFINIGLGSVSKLLSFLVVGVTLLGDIKRMNFSFGLISIMALYICWNCFSLFYSGNVSNTLERIISLSLNYMMIIVCGSISRNERELKFLEKAIVLSGWFVLVLMLFFSRVTSEFRVIIVSGGQAQDPNYLCGFLMYPIVYYFKNIFNRQKRVSSIVSFVLMIIFVLLTGSRGGLIAVIGACICCYLLNNSNKNKIQGFIISALILVFVYMIIMAIMPEELLARFDLSYTEEDRGAGRFDIWQSLLEQYADFGFVRHFAGVGAAAIRVYSRKVAHNLWIETLFELGIIGLVLIILMYIAFGKRAWRSKEKICFSVLIGYIIMSLSMSLGVFKPIYVIFTMINLNFKFETEQEMELLEDEENALQGDCCE
ncbi:MAG: O-antigen ligase family protein [Clostridia bacterium]|nr:O-antigen ligase family protein [Clostridia bacterium]